MEKNIPVQHASFSKHSSTDSPKLHNSVTFSQASDPHSRHNSIDPDIVENDTSIYVQNLNQFSEEIDSLIDVLSNADDKSNPPEFPEAVEAFLKIIEFRIKKYSTGGPNKFGKDTEEDSVFLEALRRLSKLTNSSSEFPPNSSTSTSVNRSSLVLHRAMSFLEEELRILLDDSWRNSPSNTLKVNKNASFSFKHGEPDRCSWQDAESVGEHDFPGYSPEVVTKLNGIAITMVFSGYETECCQVYSILRRNAFGEHMKRIEFEKINMEDVHRMPWESLESEISRWIKVVKACTDSLFPGERQLSEAVFSDHPSISRGLFSNLIRAVVIQLLDFAEAVSMTKRSAEKLFKFLDVYETIQEFIPAISGSCSDDCQQELKSEIFAVGIQIGGAAVSIFTDLENSIKTDASRTPVPGGAVHPLTRYVLNYLKYASEYKETLEQIFQEHAKLEESNNPVSEGENESQSPSDEVTEGSTTPFSLQLVRVMDLLDSNLESKSMLYKDAALPYIFLMNNGRYILQKVKGSSEIHQVMGDNWCRRRSTTVRQFHKNYQRETWGKVLQLLSHEGLLVNGKLSKQLLKERFKAFSLMFDEIHRTQSTWVVSDDQLQSELRVSISSVVIPAYRSFLGRFRHYLDNSKQSHKYIKYQPEDIETLIEGLFDGNHTSMARRRI